MLEPRIYRAAFVPALLAFVVAMFSLQTRPPAIPQALAADVLFDGRVALAGTLSLAEAHPDRRPGTTGDRLAAARVAVNLRQQHFAVTVDRFQDEGTRLVNVIGRRIGESPRQIVLVAPRDADRVPDAAGSAAATASLIEIARTLEGRLTQKTLVLASVDGSTLGSAGSRRLAGQLGRSGPVEAVIVLADNAIKKAHGSLLVPWSETTARGGLRLQRTLSESLLQELPRGGAGRTPGAASQFARLAFPLGLGDQAPFVDAGFDAVRMSGSGELRDEKSQPAPDADRLGVLGRATLRTVFAYDAGGRIDQKPSSFLIVADKRLPRWAVALLALALLLPLFVATVDGFARVRRRKEPIMPWLRWIGAGLVPFAVALVLAEFLVLVGQAPDGPPMPLPPWEHALDGGAGVSLGLCAVFFLASWIWVRPRLLEPMPPPGSPGAGAAVALVLTVVAIAVWVVNPYAALALLPAFHLWLLVSGSAVPPPRPAGVALVLAGLFIPLCVALVTLARLSLGPLEGVWYGFLLVTGHHVGVYTVVVSSLMAVCFAAALRIAVARRDAPEPRTSAAVARRPAR